MAGLAESKPDEHATLKDQCVGDINDLRDRIRSDEGYFRREGTCKPLMNCASPPYNGILSRAERMTRNFERSRSRRVTTSHFVNESIRYYGILDKISLKLTLCGGVCDRDDTNECVSEHYSCVRYGGEGCVQKYTTGCNLSDYFLPYSNHRRTRNLSTPTKGVR